MDKSDLQSQSEVHNLREIPKWTRRYAQSRTVPFLIGMIVFLAVFAGISGSSYLGGRAYRSGNNVAWGFCMGTLTVSMLCCLWFSVPSWGGKTIEKMSQRYYDEEGNVTMTVPMSGLNYLVGALFAACVLASVFFGRNIPIKYMQPVSALYVVPFLLYLVWYQRRFSGWLPLLWPTLYALHAILIVMGAPILFEGKLESFNMIIPTIGYGLLCGLIGHGYNRFALKRLRAFARAGE